MKRLFAVSIALAVSCGSGKPMPTPPHAATSASTTLPPTPAPAVDVTITEDPAADRWVASYHFAQPLMGVRFERGHDAPFRAKSWRALADGKKPMEWGTSDGAEALSSVEPFSDLVVSFPTDDSKKQSGYWLTATFSDGGRLLYTGHFAVALLPCGTGSSDILRTSQRAAMSTSNALDASPPVSCGPTKVSASDMRFRFRTANGRHITVFDSHATNELMWTPTFDPVEGTYVYFGDVEPRDTPFGRAIVDPALPAWMLADATTYMPRLFEWFGKDTSAVLVTKPHIFLTYGTAGLGLKGGGLKGVLQLAAWGEEWSKNDDASRVRWLEFLAHEIFHIWNGDMFRATAPWLSEGSSDLFARRALLDLGVIDRARFRREVLEEANKCMMAIGRKGVLRSGYDGTEYSCGATMLAWADAIGRAHGKSVGDILGAVFAHAPPNHVFGTDDFVRELTTLDTDRKRVEPFERVLRQGANERLDELLQSGLSRSDFSVTLAPVSAGTIDAQAAYRQVGMDLARCDCDRRINLWTRDHGIDFGESPECSVLTNVRVVAVEGHALPKDALGAYRAIVERRENKLVVSIDGRKDPVKITCRKDTELPPFKKFLQ